MEARLDRDLAGLGIDTAAQPTASFISHADQPQAALFLTAAMADPALRAEALGSLVGTAKATLVQETIAAGKQQQQQVAEAARNNAQVISGANASPLPPEGGSGGEVDVAKALREALLATDTTSVSAGLTYGSGS